MVGRICQGKSVSIGGEPNKKLLSRSTIVHPVIHGVVLKSIIQSAQVTFSVKHSNTNAHKHNQKILISHVL